MVEKLSSLLFSINMTTTEWKKNWGKEIDRALTLDWYCIQMICLEPKNFSDFLVKLCHLLTMKHEKILLNCWNESKIEKYVRNEWIIRMDIFNGMNFQAKAHLMTIYLWNAINLLESSTKKKEENTYTTNNAWYAENQVNQDEKSTIKDFQYYE